MNDKATLEETVESLMDKHGADKVLAAGDIRKQLEGFREAMLIAAVDHEQAARSLFVAARNGLVDPELGPNLREHDQAAKALRAAAALLK